MTPNPINTNSKDTSVRNRLFASFLTMTIQLRAKRSHCAHAEDPERGDVPGWVMITLMSAVLVAALLAVASPALEGLFNEAINRVSP